MEDKSKVEEALLKMFLLLHFKHSKLRIPTLQEREEYISYNGTPTVRQSLIPEELPFEVIAREMEEMINREVLQQVFDARYGDFSKAVGEYKGTFFLGIETDEFLKSNIDEKEAKYGVDIAIPAILKFKR